MVAEEQLKCNICGGITVGASQANQHESTSAHEKNKSKLEQELSAVRMEKYQNDTSVVMSWERSCL